VSKPLEFQAGTPAISDFLSSMENSCGSTSWFVEVRTEYSGSNYFSCKNRKELEMAIEGLSGSQKILISEGLTTEPDQLSGEQENPDAGKTLTVMNALKFGPFVILFVWAVVSSIANKIHRYNSDSFEALPWTVRGFIC